MSNDIIKIRRAIDDRIGKKVKIDTLSMGELNAEIEERKEGVIFIRLMDVGRDPEGSPCRIMLQDIEDISP